MHTNSQVFALKCAGAEARYAPFKRLDNRMLLWKGARESCVAGILSSGLHVPPPEAPSASYPFGEREEEEGGERGRWEGRW